MVIIDTSVILDFSRSKNKTSTWLYRIMSNFEDSAISLITHTEIYSGKSMWEKLTTKAETEELLTGFNILPITESVSLLAGKLKALHETGIIDAIIAATAIEYNAPLATLNSKHFKNIPRLKLMPHK